MGGRRKSNSLRSKEKEKNEVSWVRNLRKDELGAVIFGCKNHTITECLVNKIFGLPAAHISYVKNVTPGLKLFLFNYSDRKLHGIFEATTHGEMNISPYAWITGEGTESTPYAAQVRIHARRQCRPLLEKEFKPIIADNYYAHGLFWFELDKGQAGKLTKLFLSSPVPKSIPRAENDASWNYMFDASPRSMLEDTKVELKSEDFPGMSNMKLQENQASVLIGSTNSASEKKWTELFKTCPSSSGVKSGEGVESREVTMNRLKSERANMECEFVSKYHVTSKPLPEACSSALETECDFSPVRWEEHADHERGDDPYHISYAPSPKEITFSVIKEVKEGLIEIESEETNLHAMVLEGNSQRDEPSLINQENNSPTFAGVCTDVVHCSGFESVVVKLMQEIEGLKESNTEQWEKIDSLEHELEILRSPPQASRRPLPQLITGIPILDIFISICVCVCVCALMLKLN